MSGTLSPGQRVWVGWAPVSNMEVDGFHDPRLKQGTLACGPHPAGVEGLLWDGGYFEALSNVSWIVDVDGQPEPWLVAEYCITPIDGDGELVGEDEAARPVSA